MITLGRSRIHTVPIEKIELLLGKSFPNLTDFHSIIDSKKTPDLNTIDLGELIRSMYVYKKYIFTTEGYL